MRMPLRLQGLDHRPVPEGTFFFESDVERAAVGLAGDPGRRGAFGFRPVLVVPAVGAPVGAALMREVLTGSGR